ncbi:MAG: serine/threonine protein kinase [Bacteroidales bacterium]|nr:serine/threonine protein kinase [Bacteroidales bacterium]
MSVDRIGKFTVLATLGAGAHSSILRIRREEDGREYALKVVPITGEEDKKYLDQAKHEYRVGQMLDHPHLMKVYVLETESDWLFRIKKVKILTEFIPGTTIDKSPLLKPAKILRVLEKVASALVHMHKKGVYHADLKPNNIILGPRLMVKVIDFGLARVKDDPPKNRVQGTPEYMAPETASHKLINERTDIYNFGATAYRLATFKHPPAVIDEYGGSAIDAKTHASLLQPVQEINPGCPKELCDLIYRCLSYNAHKRPERMSEIQGVLDRLADTYSHQLDPVDLEG